MRKILIAIAFFVWLNIWLCSCSKKVYVPVEKVVTTTEIIRDTIIQVQIEKESVGNTTSDTTSTVETKYARSTATYHGETGILEHNIENKQDSILVKVVYRDKEVTKEVPTPYPVEVEKKVEVPKRMPLRWWEKIFFYAGMFSIGFRVFLIARKLNK